jgi:hypothetical protein
MANFKKGGGKAGNPSFVTFCVKALVESVISLLTYLDRLFLKISPR